MYQIGDLIVYGNNGVCEIKDINTINISVADKNKKYYILNPLFQDGVIYTPVENPKVFIRPVISKEEAQRLIAMIPSIKSEMFQSTSVQQITEHYQSAFQTHDCADLIELVMSIYDKKQYMLGQKRKFGQVDEKFMKRAEELLYGEFSVALGIPKDKVSEFIAQSISDTDNNTDTQETQD